MLQKELPQEAPKQAEAAAGGGEDLKSAAALAKAALDAADASAEAEEKLRKGIAAAMKRDSQRYKKENGSKGGQRSQFRFCAC